MKCATGCACYRHRPFSAERRSKISAAKMGHEVSPAARAKIGAATKGRKASAATRAKQSAALQSHGYARTGPARSAEYRAWDGMKQRCLNPNAAGYDRYGGRGITICPQWIDFLTFLADMGEKPEPKRQYSLDRIDNDGPYSPENCRWATRSEQQKNRPNFDPDKRSRRRR